jgi:hypothetical protein
VLGAASLAAWNVWRRPEPGITFEDVSSMIRILMRIEAKVEEIHAVLEIDGEEEDENHP